MLYICCSGHHTWMILSQNGGDSSLPIQLFRFGFIVEVQNRSLVATVTGTCVSWRLHYERLCSLLPSKRYCLDDSISIDVISGLFLLQALKNLGFCPEKHNNVFASFDVQVSQYQCILLPP